jgi:hypothetical protein
MGNTCVPKHSTHSRTCRKPAEDQVDPAFAVSGDPSRDLVRRADQMRAEPVGRRRVPGKRRVQHVAKVKKANSVVNRGGWCPIQKGRFGSRHCAAGINADRTAKTGIDYS